MSAVSSRGGVTTRSGATVRGRGGAGNTSTSRPTTRQTVATTMEPTSSSSLDPLILEAIRSEIQAVIRLGNPAGNNDDSDDQDSPHRLPTLTQVIMFPTHCVYPIA